MHGNMHNCIVYNYIYVFPTIAALTLSLHYLYNCMFSHCTPCVCFPWLCIHIIACFPIYCTPRADFPAIVDSTLPFPPIEKFPTLPTHHRCQAQALM